MKSPELIAHTHLHNADKTHSQSLVPCNSFLNGSNAQSGISASSASAEMGATSADSTNRPMMKSMDGLIKRPGTSGKSPEAEFSFSKPVPTKPDYRGTRKGPVVFHGTSVEFGFDVATSNANGCKLIPFSLPLLY